jgi:PAS domain S-box-containing protein
MTDFLTSLGGPAPTDLLQTLLEVSLTGTILFQPLYEPGAEATLTDFAYVYLNPAAQRMLGLPVRPAESFLSLYPHATETGIFAFYRQAFLTDEQDRYDVNYQADGLDNYFHLLARRSGELLVVSFTDTAEQARGAAEQALRAAQARERAAAAQLERERQLLTAVLAQAPVAIGLFQGDDLVVAQANERMAALWGHPPAQVVGRPLLEGVPELRGQGFDELLREVGRTHIPFSGTGAPAQLVQPDGQVATRYFDFVYQPLFDPAGALLGVLDIAIDVSEQVLARRRLQQLNQELETRVQERTRQLAEQQRLLQQILGQVPAAIATFSGPEHRFTFFNADYKALVEGRAHLGQPLVEAIPEVGEQGFVDLLNRVYATQQPLVSRGVPVQLQGAITGNLAQRYVDLSYQALLNEQGHSTGILAFVVDVTKQVQAQQAREAQQGELQRIFEQAPVAIAVFRGPNHIIEMANDLQLAIWDRSREQALGKGLFELLPEITGQGFEEYLAGVLTTGTPYVGTDVPARFTRQGVYEEIFVSFVYTPLREADGHISGVVVIVTNTTEQVLARRQADTLQAALLAAAQRQAHQREELFQVFEQAPAAILLLREPDHRIEYVNPAYQRLFPEVVLRGRLLVEAHPGVTALGMLAQLDRVYATGQPYVGEELPIELTLVPGQPTQTRYFNFTYQPYQEQGLTVGVSLFAYDVTASALVRRQVAEQARQFRELYEQAPMAVCILRGPEFIVELANPAILHIWGLTAEESLGRPRLGLIPETSRASLRAVLEMPYRTRRTHHVQEFPVTLGRSHSGQPDRGYFNFIYQPLLNEQGETIALTCMGIEVTELVLARQQVQTLNEELLGTNQELSETNQQLTRTNVDLDNFIYTASHDLKQPIANIEGLLLALQHELPQAGPPSELVASLLELMQASIERFQKTISDLTEVSKLQQANAQPTQALDISRVIEEVALDLAPQLLEAGGQLTVAVPASTILTAFSEKNLRSVVYNLLSNAIKYRDPARPIRVRISSEPVGQQLHLHVQDNGLGLDARQQTRLFGLFQRLHTHVEGTGIGLYMVKKIVENAAGTIAVQSQAGVGSTFTIALPLAT